MSILQELWYGNIRPNENKIITNEEKRLIELIARHHETLSSSLKNDDLDVFEKYVDCFTEYASLIEAQVFEIGFKLALNLTPFLSAFSVALRSTPKADKNLNYLIS